MLKLVAKMSHLFATSLIILQIPNYFHNLLKLFLYLVVIKFVHLADLAKFLNILAKSSIFLCKY